MGLEVLRVPALHLELEALRLARLLGSAHLARRLLGHEAVLRLVQRGAQRARLVLLSQEALVQPVVLALRQG